MSRTIEEIKEDIAKDINNIDAQRLFDMYKSENASGIPVDRHAEICNAEREDETDIHKDMVEVVRCGECIYKDGENCPALRTNCLGQSFTHPYLKFCSYGERRVEDATK